MYEYHLNSIVLQKNLRNIVKACLKGNRQSQHRLYQMFASRLYGVSLRYADNEEDAKDILQEGFIKIFENLGQYKQNGSLEGWMRKIIVNTGLEKIRKEGKIRLVEDETYASNIHMNYEHVLEEMQHKDLLKMIQDLSVQYRMVFNLYVIEGYSHREISQKLQISEGTSKSNLSRAREILKKKIKEQYIKQSRVTKVI